MTHIESLSVRLHSFRVPDAQDFTLASQRLAIAEPVARYKWAHRQSITDTPRENALLAQVADLASNAGVDHAFAQAFFRDQIDASKDVQTALFDHWYSAGPPQGPAPDLVKSIRPQLDRLTPEMVDALLRVQSMREVRDCPRRLAQAVDELKSTTRHDATTSAALTHALRHVCDAGEGVDQAG